jgi:hypothetical protein
VYPNERKIRMQHPSNKNRVLAVLSGLLLLFLSAGAITGTYTGILGGSTGGTTNTILKSNGTLGTQVQAASGVTSSGTGQISLAPAANASPITITGYSVTGSGTTPMIDYAGTWNTSGSPTAFKLNITNTGSGASALLSDLQIGGVSQFSVSKSGAVVALGALSGSNIQASDLATNLYLWWKLDNSVNDSSGNARNGTATAITYVNDIWGVASHAADFNGTTSKVQLTGLLGSQANLTVAGWFKCDSIDGSGASDLFNIGSAVTLRFAAGSTSIVIEETSGSNWVTHDTLAGAFGGKGWHHFAVVADDTNNRLKFFIDGNCTLDVSWTVSIFYGSGGNFVLGQHPAATFFWHGQADDIRVYSSVLDQMKIKELAAAVPRAAF